MFMLGYLLNTNDDAKNNKWKYTTLKVDTFTKLIEGLSNWFIVGDIIRAWYIRSCLQLIQQPVKFSIGTSSMLLVSKNLKISIKSHRIPMKVVKIVLICTIEGKVNSFRTSIDQILSKNGSYINNRELQWIPCVIYAFRTDITNWRSWKKLLVDVWPYQKRERIKLCLTNCYNAKHLHKFCEELSVYCLVHYYDEYCNQTSV